MMPAKPGRRWIPRRLNLATLLALVAAVGGSTGWYIREVRVQRRTVQALREAGATVLYDWEWAPGAPSSRKGELSGWRRLVADRFGPDAVASVVAISFRVGPSITTPDEQMELVGRLGSLRSLSLGAMPASPRGAAQIGRLKRLEIIRLFDLSGKEKAGRRTALAQLTGLDALRQLVIIGGSVADEDLADISRLGGLEMLALESLIGAISDAGVARLAGLSRLQKLVLKQTLVTDAGLRLLVGLEGLKTLDVTDSFVTAAGATEFRKAHPAVTVRH